MKVEKVTIRPRGDCLYRYHEWRSVKTPDGGRDSLYAPLGLYRFVMFVRHCHTLQEMAVYEGVGGPDDGKGYACPLADFTTHFTEELQAPARPAEPTPEKTAGEYQAGTGW